MRRGKDDEKTMGPMFPRLHVNDTEKGGPRAPPRNKMALYEQLSIPSQRFNGGVVPFNPKSVPPSSPAEGARSERSTFFPLQQPPSFHSAEGTNNRFSNLNNQLAQQEHKKKQDEDDFRVPIFVQQSRISQAHSGNHQNRGHDGPSPLTFSSRLSNIENARLSTKVQKENSQDFVKSSTNQSSKQNAKDPLKETNGPSSFGHINASNNSKRSHSDVNLRGEGVENTLWGDSVLNEATRATGNGNSSQQEVLRSPNDPTNGDAVSETSMVDSICGVDISPDDVVGIIGEKHFWKARRAIVNQQRVFAVQVFELHRLIKVQKLIAGSPQLLGGDDANLRKPPRVSLIKKIPLEYVMEPISNGPKQPDNEDVEFLAENGSQTTGCRPFPGPDPKMGPWSYSQPAGHQWLIPVMSPSEGLVYKPYLGPGFMDPSCGPPGSMPVIGHNFPNYMVPPHHPDEPPPLLSHGYFPPYMMPQSISHQMAPPFNVPSEPDVPDVVKLRARKDGEVQASTASSPDQKTALPLFPTSPRAEPGPQRAEPARVIRVVPHNARSATASVARIFQCIQEERKQHDSG